MHFFLTLCSVTLNRQLEISCGGSIYSMAMGKTWKLRCLFVCLYDPVVKYLPARHNHPQFIDAETRTQRSHGSLSPSYRAVEVRFDSRPEWFQNLYLSSTLHFFQYLPLFLKTWDAQLSTAFELSTGFFLLPPFIFLTDFKILPL